MNNRIRALASWVLALTFLCLIVTGFAIWFHLDLFGLRGRPLKVTHINLAMLSVVAGIGHIFYNWDTLCKYVWIRKRGPNMLGTFVAALVMTTAVIAVSAITPTRCEEEGRGGRSGEYGQHQGQDKEHRQPDGIGRGQGGEGRGMGFGKGLQEGK